MYLTTFFHCTRSKGAAQVTRNLEKLFGNVQENVVYRSVFENFVAQFSFRQAPSTRKLRNEGKITASEGKAVKNCHETGGKQM